MLGIETILNLGDHFSGPLAAGETADLMLARDMISIRGNHDRWLSEATPETIAPSEKDAIGKLTDRHLAWLRQLPSTHTISDDIFLCHGTPASDNAYWLETVSPEGEVSLRDYSDIAAEADGITCSLVLCAHTHTQRAIRLTDGRLIVNPGSVGAPGYTHDVPFEHVMQTGTPDASYAVVHKHGAKWQASFRYVPYDSDRMAAMATAADRPEWARALSTGWVRPDR